MTTLKTLVLIVAVLWCIGFVGMHVNRYMKTHKTLSVWYLEYAAKYALVFDLWLIVQITRFFFRSLYWANKSVKIGKVTRKMSIDEAVESIQKSRV